MRRSRVQCPSLLLLLVVICVCGEVVFGVTQDDVVGDGVKKDTDASSRHSERCERTSQPSRKLKVWLTPGCPYVMKVLTFINAAKLQDQVEYIQDSPEQRKYLAEKAGKESAAMPAMELPDRGIIMFPEEVNQIM